MHIVRVWITITVLLCSFVRCMAETQVVPSQITERVRRLIQQLDADGYVQRKQAKIELQNLGHEAFDQLLEAQYSDSSEISLSAKQLIGRLTVAWSRETDPPIVQQIMRDYERMHFELRETKSTWLAQLEDGLGFDAAVRIVRYEPSELLSKQAAIAIMNNLDQLDDLQMQALREAIDRVLATSQRSASVWLQTFGKNLADPGVKNQAVWQALAIAETKLTSGPRSAPSVAAAIHKRAAVEAFRWTDDVIGKASLDNLVELQQDDVDGLMRTAAWLLDQDRPDLFLEVIWNRFDEHKATSPKFLYLAAEAYQTQGDDDRANELANKAYELSVDNPKIADPILVAFARIESATEIEHRGHVEWAIRELKRLAKMNQSHWRIQMIQEQSAIMLSELLHDRGRDEEAADVMAALLKEDANVFFPDSDSDGESAALISRMHYFRSEHYRQQSNREKQVEFLEKAIKAHPIDADVLIAMHRLPRTDKEWKATTKKKIRMAVDVFDRKLQRLQGAGELENRRDVAENLNQIAWLVSNTEGDFEKAIKQSRKSLELMPHSAGRLDTLGRAYFAVGDVENAIKYQSRAVRLQPHQQQIIRQLEQFRAFRKDTQP